MSKDLRTARGHGEQPVDVAVALVEAFAIDEDIFHRILRCGHFARVDGYERPLEGVEDPPVVVSGDQTDHRRDDEGLAITGEDTPLHRE